MPPPLTKAFVFAAGLGTRLRPYTLHTPKPLLEAFGRPLLEYLLCYLRDAGIRHVTVNAAHLAEQFEALPARGSALGLDVVLSRQPAPLEHGGDLAYATAFFEGLAPDERFVALNGDTLFWLDPAALHRAAQSVSPEEPLLIVTHTSATNPLRVRGGRLVGIRDLPYSDEEPEGAADDFGLKVFHAGVRRFLPMPGVAMSLHGREGLIGRVIASGATVRVRPAEGAERVEIGTVADYEGRASNAALRALTARLCG